MKDLVSSFPKFQCDNANWLFSLKTNTGKRGKLGKKEKKKKETNFHVYKFCNLKHLLNSFIRKMFF